MSTLIRSATASVARLTEDEARQWRQRLRERAEATLRERAGRAEIRRQRARRRAHGMVDRHAARLARGQPAGPFAPDLTCTE